MGFVFAAEHTRPDSSLSSVADAEAGLSTLCQHSVAPWVLSLTTEPQLQGPELRYVYTDIYVRIYGPIHCHLKCSLKFWFVLLINNQSTLTHDWLLHQGDFGSQ